MRAASGFSAATSQIFRCMGFQPDAGQSDDWGLRDAVCWMLFLIAACGWFLFLFVPQRSRLARLELRRHTLARRLKAEKHQLQRLQHGIAALARDDRYAWERAARGRLGWLEPGEITDLAALYRGDKASHTPPPP